MKHQRKILVALLSVLVVALLAFWLWPDKKIVNNTGVKKPAANSTSNSGQPASRQSALSAVRSTGAAGGTPTNPSQPSLSAPGGSFVSSHLVSVTDQEDSTCVTTAGAECEITFTNASDNSKVVSLSAKQANSSGAAEWLWKPGDIGLSSGNWKITAVSRLGGQAKSTADQRLLVIK
jgi:hypothetical protein